MRVTSKMSADNSVYNINMNRQRMDRLNEMITSQMRVSTPSLDPVATSKILSLESQVKTTNQYISNIKNGQMWLDMEGTALEGVQKNLVEIRRVVGTAVSGLDDPYKRNEALSSLKLFRSQLLDIPNSTLMGDQYIFSGFKGNVKPFEATTIAADSTAGSTALANIDTTDLHPGMPITGTGIPEGTIITAITTPGVGGAITISNAATSTTAGGAITFDGKFTGSNDSFQIEVSQGLELKINVTGGTLLRGQGSPPGIDVIKTLDQLILDVSNGNQAGAIANMALIDEANVEMMSTISDVGMRVARFDNALAYQVRANDVLKTLLSNLQEVDMAKAAVELSNQKIAFEASLSATAKITPLSLLDYL